MSGVTWFNPIFIPLEWKDEGIVPSLPPIGPTITLYSGDEYCGMEVYEDNVSAQDVKRLKAKRFVELIMSGKTPSKAAKEVNEQLSKYQNREEVQLAIKKVVEGYHFPPEVRKMYSRALNMKIAMEQSLSADPKAAKVALEALKLMATDDEVGWLNPKAPAPSSGAMLPPGLEKLLGAARTEDVTEGEEDEDDKAA